MDELLNRLDEQIRCFRKKVDEKDTQPIFTAENVLWILEEIQGGKRG